MLISVCCHSVRKISRTFVNHTFVNSESLRKALVVSLFVTIISITVMNFDTFDNELDNFACEAQRDANNFQGKMYQVDGPLVLVDWRLQRIENLCGGPQFRLGRREEWSLYLRILHTTLRNYHFNSTNNGGIGVVITQQNVAEFLYIKQEYRRLSFQTLIRNLIHALLIAKPANEDAVNDDSDRNVKRLKKQ
jgi:hypothetical protein